MYNTKILVNFQTKKIIHTEHHAGSKEYKFLISKGYEQVGIIKIQYDGFTQVKSTLKIYWGSEYFEPGDKYLRMDEPII